MANKRPKDEIQALYALVSIFLRTRTSPVWPILRFLSHLGRDARLVGRAVDVDVARLGRRRRARRQGAAAQARGGHAPQRRHQHGRGQDIPQNVVIFKRE